MERWREEFLAEHGDRWRNISGRWWMLNDQGFWSQAPAREELFRLLYAASGAGGDPTPSYLVNRMIAGLSADLRTIFLPGRPSREVWPQRRES